MLKFGSVRSNQSESSTPGLPTNGGLVLKYFLSETIHNGSRGTHFAKFLISNFLNLQCNGDQSKCFENEQKRLPPAEWSYEQVVGNFQSGPNLAMIRVSEGVDKKQKYIEIRKLSSFYHQKMINLLSVWVVRVDQMVRVIQVMSGATFI